MSKEIQRLIKLTGVLRKYHADFPPNALAIFAMLGRNEALSASDLIERLGMPKATVSRNLRMLGDRLSPTKEGLNLIRLEHDANDYRIRRGFLTEKGKEFLEPVSYTHLTLPTNREV